MKASAHPPHKGSTFLADAASITSKTSWPQAPLCEMVQAWWAAGLTIPAVIVKGFLGGRNKGRKEDELRAMYV